MANDIIIYYDLDVSITNPRDFNLYAYHSVAVPDTKKGRALFQPYKEKNNWRGMRIAKRKISLQQFNNLANKPELLQSEGF